MPDGVSTAVKKVYDALKLRLQRTGDFRVNTEWTYHDGAPDPTNLPTDDVSVWLMLSNVAQDQENAPFNAEFFVATWQIEIVIRDGGIDPHGFSPEKGFQALSDVIDVLTKRLGDISLDDSIDFSGDINIDHGIGRASGGDRAIEDLILTVKTYLPLQNCRLASGA